MAGFRFTATSRRSISHHSLDGSLNMTVEEIELEEKREAHAAQMAKMAAQEEEERRRLEEAQAQFEKLQTLLEALESYQDSSVDATMATLQMQV